MNQIKLFNDLMKLERWKVDSVELKNLNGCAHIKLRSQAEGYQDFYFTAEEVKKNKKIMSCIKRKVKKELQCQN